MIPVTVVVMDESSEARWLAERSEAAGYVFIFVLVSFGIWGAMRSCAFACPPKPRAGRTVLEAVHSIGFRGRGKKEKLIKTVRKCNEYRE